MQGHNASQTVIFVITISEILVSFVEIAVPSRKAGNVAVVGVTTMLISAPNGHKGHCSMELPQAKHVKCRVARSAGLEW